jgi:hypothetical protein
MERYNKLRLAVEMANDKQVGGGRLTLYAVSAVQCQA